VGLLFLGHFIPMCVQQEGPLNAEVYYRIRAGYKWHHTIKYVYCGETLFDKGPNGSFALDYDLPVHMLNLTIGELLQINNFQIK